MSSTTRSRLTALTAVISGALIITFNIASFMGLVPSALNINRTLVTVLLTMFTLIGVYAAQSRRAGLLGLLGFVVAQISLTLNFANAFALAFISPVLVEQFPGALPAIGQGPYATAVSVMFLLFTLGYLLFGIATARARIFPAATGWLLAIGAVVSYVGMMLPLNVGALLTSAAYIWIGVFLWGGDRAVAPEPQPRLAV